MEMICSVSVSINPWECFSVTQFPSICRCAWPRLSPQAVCVAGLNRSASDLEHLTGEVSVSGHL